MLVRLMIVASAESEDENDPDPNAGLTADLTADLSAELNELLRSSPERLDLILAHIARLDPSSWPVAQVVEHLDELAAAVPGSGDADELIGYVFTTLGFIGNARYYYEPANSLIHRVLEHRRGIPLSLAVIASEISRRSGGTMAVVGFPGHVLLGHGATDNRMPDRFFDPFAAGSPLGMKDLAGLLDQVQPGLGLRAEMLLPMSAHDIALRTLNNLSNAYQRLGMLSQLAGVLGLRLSLDGTTTDDRRRYAGLLGALGRHDASAAQFEQLQRLDPDNAASYGQMIERLVAHRN